MAINRNIHDLVVLHFHQFDSDARFHGSTRWKTLSNLGRVIFPRRGADFSHQSVHLKTLQVTVRSVELSEDVVWSVDAQVTKMTFLNETKSLFLCSSPLLTPQFVLIRLNNNNDHLSNVHHIHLSKCIYVCSSLFSQTDETGRWNWTEIVDILLPNRL